MMIKLHERGIDSLCPTVLQQDTFTKMDTPFQKLTDHELKNKNHTCVSGIELLSVFLLQMTCGRKLTS